MRHRSVLLTLPLLAAALLAAQANAAGPAPPVIVTGQAAGWPDVRGWDETGSQSLTGNEQAQWPLAFSPYPTYQQGVRVAVGDVDGDGRPEIVTAPGGSALTTLDVFDGRSFQRLRRLPAYPPAAIWFNGAFVATGDTNGDGRAEIVEGLDKGCCTSLRVWDAFTGQQSAGFFPYSPQEQAGARVAAADLNGDGSAEVLAVPVSGTRISAFAPTGGAAFRSYSPFGSEAVGGAAIAAADLVGDSAAEIVAAAVTASGAQVKVLDARTGRVLASFFPYGSAAVSALGVATGDVDGRGGSDLVVAAVTAEGTEVKALDLHGGELASFFAVDPGIAPGASVAAGDLDGDGTAEIVLGSGPTNAPNPPLSGPEQRVTVFDRDGRTLGGFSAYPGIFQGGVRVALGDVTGDSAPEIVTAPGPGMPPEIGLFRHDWAEDREGGNRIGAFLAFEPGFEGGASVAVGDVDGDGKAEVVAGPGAGRPADVRVFASNGHRIASFPAFEEGYRGGVTVAAGDVDGDGKAEIVAGTDTSPPRIRVFEATGELRTLIQPGGSTTGVTVAVADLEGDGRAEILAGATAGSEPWVTVLDGSNGAVIGRFLAFDRVFRGGVHVAGGDLDQDGRDEILVGPGNGGNGQVRFFDRRFVQTGSFTPYTWTWPGAFVAVKARLGLPLVAEPRRVKLRARRRSRFVVARFRDTAGGSEAAVTAWIEWGDGTAWKGAVLGRGNGVYDVRSTKRYSLPGAYEITVTLTDAAGRRSVARSRATVVRQRKRA
jgi:hypothetical protein